MTFAKRKQIPTDVVIGQPWGSIFEAKDGKFHVCKEVPQIFKETEEPLRRFSTLQLIYV
jgi:hypothetical protein